MSREKQIEKQVILAMADDVRRIRESYFGQADYLFAKKLFEDGYSKQSEGEWKFDFTLEGDDFYECSVCGRQEVINVLCKERNPAEHYPYCHCGAKMKGESE